MPNKTMLTVNVITYNHEKWIAQCLDSVLMQKTDFDFIIRIFDDCSTDGTTAICEEYAKKYPQKITLYKAKKNLGMKDDVLINALRSYDDIQTPYFCFIEGDDYRVNENGFQMQVDALEQHPKCAFSGGGVVILRDGKMTYCPMPYPDGVVSTQQFIANHTTYFFPCLASRIIRTSAIPKKYKQPIDYIRDVDQFYFLMSKGGIYYVNQHLCVYRITGKGVCTSNEIFTRLYQLGKVILSINNFTKNIFKLNLVNHFQYHANWIFTSDKQKPKNIKPPKPISKTKTIYKKIIRYILPPLVLDILNGPRNISRFIRKKLREQA